MRKWLGRVFGQLEDIVTTSLYAKFYIAAFYTFRDFGDQTFVSKGECSRQNRRLRLKDNEFVLALLQRVLTGFYTLRLVFWFDITRSCGHFALFSKSSNMAANNNWDFVSGHDSNSLSRSMSIQGRQLLVAENSSSNQAQLLERDSGFLQHSN